jgi:hypothetical protein
MNRGFAVKYILILGGKLVKRKVLAFLLSAAMVILVLPAMVLAFEFSDMPDDWSKTALESAVENGLLTGADGKLMPRDNLTRAQMAAVINRAFGATGKASLNGYTDVAPGAWYYDDMAKAVQMKTLLGSGDKLNPDSNITREEAFVVLARAFKLTGSPETILDMFSDKSEINSWSEDGIASLVSAGYITGSNGRLYPKQNITRAEFAQIMYNLLKHYIKTLGTYSRIPEGNIMINAPDITLKDVTVKGDLIIGDGAGDGNIILDNVKVTGRTVVRGGGPDSIKIIGGSELGSVIISKVDGNIRVVTESGVAVEVIYIDDGKDDVIIEGEIDSVKVDAANVPVVLQNAVVTSMTVTAPDASITIESNATVDMVSVWQAASDVDLYIDGTVTTVTTEADGTLIDGGGTVVNASIQGDDCSLNTAGTKVEVGESISGTTIGSQTVDSGTTGITDSKGELVIPATGGRRSSGSSRVNINAISIDGEARVGITLSTTVTPTNATVNYQWQRADAEDGVYTDISGATSATFTPIGDNVDKYLKVSATGTGSYTGTVTSEPAGAVLEAQYASTEAVDFDVTVPYGTSEENTISELAPAVGIAGTEGEAGTASIQWTIAGYDENTADDYTATGGLSLPDGWTGSPADVTATVTVQAQELAAINSIAGTPEIGELLTAGALAPEGATSTYQWQYHDGSGWSDIEGATANIYTVAVPVTVGDEVRVTAEGTGNYTGTLESNAVTIVATQVTGIGAIAGTPELGEELTAGALTPAGAAVAYQWQYHDGSGWTDIEGATANTYTVAAPVTIGDDIRVIAEGTENYTGTLESNAVTITAQVTGIGTIEGTPELGEELTAGALTPEEATVTYQWQRQAGGEGSWTDIEGATVDTYTVAEPVGAGDEVRVAAEGTGNYTGTLESNAVTITAQVTGIGAIEGTPELGEELTAGALTPEDATVTYQWQRQAGGEGSWTDIEGATVGTYTVAEPVGAGDEVRVAAEGTGNYTGILESNAVTIVATQVTGIGAIEGTPKMGEELTAGALTPEEATVTYQWQRQAGGEGSWTDIEGATTDTYTVAEPVGAGDEVRVAAEGTGNYTGTLESNAVTIVATQVSGIGEIDGTPEMGEELTAGALTPEGAAVAYQWQYNGGSGWSDIEESTANTYTVAAPVTIGDDIRVIAEGTGNYTGTVQSTGVTITAQVTGIGEIDGTPEVGEELTAGALTPAGATVTYKWQYHNGSGWSDIEGATANTYTVAAPAAIGDDIRVVAEGTGNYTGTVQSTAVTITAQVTGIGSIAGTPEMGEELTAGTLTPEGATVTYKWQYNDGSGWSDIAGATANTYTVAAPVTVGNEVRVAAEGTGNYTGTLESNAVTIAVTQVTGIGAIDGTPKMGEELTAGALTPEGATATYQWQYNDGSGWADIAGATANTYTVASPAAIGDEVRVVAEGTGNYTGTVQSAAVTITATQVTGITVTGEGGSITVVTPGGTLQMVAVVEPENATDDSVTWSVSEFYDGLASIDQTGLLTLTGHEYGTVYVTATANDGSGEEGTLAVNVVYAKSIGQEGPAGGIVFYDKGDYIDGWRYLEAADPSTIAQGEPWKNTTTAWSNVNSTLVGTSTDVGSGQANTNLILNQGGHTASAAKIASEHWSYTDESYDDWFLPSLDELNLIFSVLFDDELVTFNPMHTYWSSSEIDLDEAYGKAYASQEYLWYYKSDQYLYVWPIRAF